ncbi:hypothetical protein UFOVP141_54 [uncultured Caudovirales phage]|uniref:Uncharacterized protein n=1 Tax=uncultured Caudovirales phage TaxID=2100421 RepID=A0A6J7VJZ2_9CAUD|nr:hypothetical protein UFOVP141_54 [uncultured Caudovirales phage]
MALMRFGPWSGVDLRTHFDDVSDALDDAVNVQLTSAKQVERRPAVVYAFEMSEHSVGLYTGGSRLRSAVTESTAAPVPFLKYDLIDDGDYSKVLNVAIDGLDQPYMLIERTLGGIEVHYSRASKASRQQLPFTPEAALAAADGRVWMLDKATGWGRYTAIGDWTMWKEGGATVDNYIDIPRMAKGARARSLGMFMGRLAFFGDSVILIYRTGPSPDMIAIENAIFGAGTSHSQAIIPTPDDTLYLGHGLFRRLRNSSITMDAKDDPFGSPIEGWSRTINLGDNLIGYFSPSMGRALFAKGSTVYVCNLQAGGGFTRWELPVEPSAFAEHGKDTFFRAGNRAYRFDRKVDRDMLHDGPKDIPLLALPKDGHGGTLSQKSLHVLSTLQTGPCKVRMMLDGRLAMPFMMPGRGTTRAYVDLTGEGRSIGMRIEHDAAPAEWSISGAVIEHQPTGG